MQMTWWKLPFSRIHRFLVKHFRENKYWIDSPLAYGRTWIIGQIMIYPVMIIILYTLFRCDFVESIILGIFVTVGATICIIIERKIIEQLLRMDHWLHNK